MSTGLRSTDSGPELPPDLALHPGGPADGPAERRGLLGARGSRRRRWWRRLRLPVAVLVVLAVLAAGTWLVGFSTVLTARSVSVEGATTLSTAEVEAAARVPFGVPLARLDTTAVADRVAGLAPVRTVSVTRRFPHSVVIRVTERTPAALLVGDSGVVRLVDTTGALYPPTGAVPDDLPVLVDSGVALDAAAVESAVTVLGALPAPVGAEVTAVVVTDDDAVLLDLRIPARVRPAGRGAEVRRTLVRWGTAADTPLKARVLAVLLKTTTAPWLDLSAPSVPVSRPSIPRGALPNIPDVGRAAH